MRKFYLENANGDRIGLNGESGIRLGNPAGLGVRMENTYSEIGNGFLQLEHKKVKKEPFTCDLTFTRSAYSRYRQFVNWVAAAGTLYLIYKPFGDTEYYSRVELEYLTKDELSHGKWLVVPCALKMLTSWYVAEPTELTITTEDANEKRYGWDEEEQDYCYTYSDDLHYGSDADGLLSVRIAPSGHAPAELVLRCYGELVNPTIRLVGLTTGTVYGICSLSSEMDAAATFGPTDTLELSTREEDSHVVKIAADGTRTDLLGAVDPSQEIYFKAPTTETVELTLESDAVFTGSASLQVYYYFWSV